MFSVEHAIFPANTRGWAECSWWFACFKLISIVSVSKKEVKVCVDVHMDNDGRIMHDVVMQVLQVSLIIPKLFDPLD